MTQDTAPQSPPRPAPNKKVTAPTRADRKPRGTRKKSLVKPLDEFFTSVGVMVAVVNEVDGMAIVQGSERLAKALNNVAKDNAAVYRSLERMLTGSAWGGVIVAASGIVLPIMANHDLLPFQIPGVEIPNVANIESMPAADIPDIGHNVGT